MMENFTNIPECCTQIISVASKSNNRLLKKASLRVCAIKKRMNIDNASRVFLSNDFDAMVDMMVLKNRIFEISYRLLYRGDRSPQGNKSPETIKNPDKNIFGVFHLRIKCTRF